MGSLVLLLELAGKLYEAGRNVRSNKEQCKYVSCYSRHASVCHDPGIRV